LTPLTGPLRALAARGLPVSLLIVGGGSRTDLVAADYGALPVELVPNYSGADLPGLVARMDIGLMPLDDGPWERGKCAMKALIYMAGGCPAVCSPVGETNFVIEDRRTGFLARTPAEWEAVLAQLVVDHQLRADVGARGRQVVMERYSADVCFELLYTHALAPLVAGEGAGD
jgi:glycosyltransferase involved in cell wall biosynthesis